MKGIREMFEELSGPAFEEQVEQLRDHRRLTASERTALWRALNPEKYKALRSRCRKNWRKRYPEKYRAHKRAQKARKRRRAAP